MNKLSLYTLFYICIIAIYPVGAQITGKEILKKMDFNRIYQSLTYSGTMKIQIGNQIRTKKMDVKAINNDEPKAIVQFTNPEDQGTKYLMIGENLWIYFPSENDIVKISGHLLKDGMMGSDVSYEDALKSDDLREKYSVTIEGDTTINQRSCYLIVLNGITRDVPYFKRRMSVDKEWFIPWREEMYAKSGKLLKVSSIKDVQQFGDRNFPVRSEIVNMLRKNSKTTFEMKNLKFNEIIDESLFSMRYLSR